MKIQTFIDLLNMLHTSEKSKVYINNKRLSSKDFGELDTENDFKPITEKNIAYYKGEVYIFNSYLEVFKCTSIYGITAFYERETFAEAAIQFLQDYCPENHASACKDIKVQVKNTRTLEIHFFTCTLENGVISVNKGSIAESPNANNKKA